MSWQFGTCLRLRASHRSRSTQRLSIHPQVLQHVWMTSFAWFTSLYFRHIELQIEWKVYQIQNQREWAPALRQLFWLGARILGFSQVWRWAVFSCHSLPLIKNRKISNKMGLQLEAGLEMAQEGKTEEWQEHPMARQHVHLGGRIVTTLTWFFPDLFCLLAHRLSRFQILYCFLVLLPYHFEIAVPWVSPPPSLGTSDRMWSCILNHGALTTEAVLGGKVHWVIKENRAWQDVLPDVVFPIRLCGFLAKVYTSHRLASI